MSNWVEASVKDIVWWTDTLFSLIVNADVEPFKAGQFTKLSMMMDEKRIARAYSYVNAPSSPDLEFYLINVADGLLSQQLAKLKPGDTVLDIASNDGTLLQSYNVSGVNAHCLQVSDQCTFSNRRLAVMR